MRARTAAIAVAVVLTTTAVLVSARPPPSWKPLRADGIHDPDNPSLDVMQDPGTALREMPPDTVGNQVRWVEALRRGDIAPRTNILPGTEVQVLDQDILMTDTAGMPIVLFPHRVHTEWLDCANCHDKIFERKAGATKLSMFTILQGRHCGRCHGAVAFPLTECRRCHSVPRKTLAP